MSSAVSDTCAPDAYVDAFDVAIEKLSASVAPDSAACAGAIESLKEAKEHFNDKIACINESLWEAIADAENNRNKDFRKVMNVLDIEPVPGELYSNTITRVAMNWKIELDRYHNSYGGLRELQSATAVKNCSDIKQKPVIAFAQATLMSISKRLKAVEAAGAASKDVTLKHGDELAQIIIVCMDLANNFPAGEIDLTPHIEHRLIR